MVTIWIDGDACPRAVKEIVFKASQRLQMPVLVVANSSMMLPRSPLIKLVQVPSGADVADAYIVQNAHPDDIVITADIPLADLLVAKGIVTINPRGELYDAANIKDKLSMRNFMDEMRGAGLTQGGGPPPFNDRDKQQFASTFDRIVQKKTKKN